MKIYASRRSTLDKFIGKDLWFKIILTGGDHWVQIRHIAYNGFYGCYKVSVGAIRTQTSTLRDAKHLWYICHMHGACPLHISTYKTRLEQALQNGDVKTTEELFGYSEEELASGGEDK